MSLEKRILMGEGGLEQPCCDCRTDLSNESEFVNGRTSRIERFRQMICLQMR